MPTGKANRFHPGLRRYNKMAVLHHRKKPTPTMIAGQTCRLHAFVAVDTRLSPAPEVAL